MIVTDNRLPNTSGNTSIANEIKWPQWRTVQLSNHEALAF